MHGPARVTIAQRPTGMSGLDEIVGGRLPEYSFNVIVGTPGSGKTTMAHQSMVALASTKRPALYFLVGALASAVGSILLAIPLLTRRRSPRWAALF